MTGEAATSVTHGLSLRLPWPPSVNHYWRRARHGGMHVSAEGVRYRREVCALLAGTKGIPGRVAVVVHAYPPDRRARDLDNLGKALLDAMQHAGVYESDSRIDDLRFIRGPVAKPGAVAVTVTPMEATP